MRILNNIDLNYNQILNALAHKLATDPVSPQEGQIWYNTTTRQLKYFNGTSTIIVLDNFIPLSQKGTANGVASLDSGGKVPIGQLPDTIVGSLDYQTTWNASTNTPTLPSAGTGLSKGDYWKVSVAGSTNLGGIIDWKVGDWAIWNGSAWDKIDQSESVSTVAGKTGAVVLTVGDIAGALAAASNLNDLADKPTARGNLGLGTAATRNVPATGNAAATEVVLGNDSRLTSQLQKYNANIGDGTNNVFVITHNLNTQDVIAELRETVSPFAQVLTDIERTSANTVTVRFATTPTLNQYRVTVIG